MNALKQINKVEVLYSSFVPAQAGDDVKSAKLRAEINGKVLVQFNDEQIECYATNQGNGTVQAIGFMGRAKTGKVVTPAYVYGCSDGYQCASMGGAVRAGLLAYDLAAVDEFFM